MHKINGIWKDLTFNKVSENIYSVLSPNDRYSVYDEKARMNDILVGNSIYNRLIWGYWPSQYEAFCRQSLASSSGGVYVDAGCGSLFFTANVYASCKDKRLILMDRSLDMLKRGRDRILKKLGGVPDNIIFIQGDVFILPFVDEFHRYGLFFRSPACNCRHKSFSYGTVAYQKARRDLVYFQIGWK